MSQNQLPSEKSTPSVEHPSPNYLEWYRVTTDCLSKIIAPIIVLFLLLFYSPQIKILFDKFNEKIKDLEKAKIGNVEVTFENAFAEQNAKVTALEQQVNAIKKTLPTGTQKELQQINEQFKNNSEYTVLVFYRDAQSRDATEIVNNLLNKGFSSFASSTDLAEAKTRPDNTIRILYTNKGRDKIEQVEEIIRKLIDDKKIDGNVELENKPSLERGDIQILLY
jgi:hypothetical protein